MAYTETRRHGNADEDPEAVEDYMAVFAELRGVALPPHASRDLMYKIQQEFSHE
ncbi:hypothetical protein EKD16_24215 [Streptomonospora litoralis]|uniref:DUF5753 domain-containing protein n=2 Tax=Streptomonospora litoralis TaxID=2498135 RepID=A0A4P6Q724_9ACTN|nr:hypothetical protein EKD16_24215 [Streptomonospora litoralis]